MTWNPKLLVLHEKSANNMIPYNDHQLITKPKPFSLILSAYQEWKAG